MTMTLRVLFRLMIWWSFAARHRCLEGLVIRGEIRRDKESAAAGVVRGVLKLNKTLP